MALPALRQPKFVLGAKTQKTLPADISHVMITLKDERKLVITTDSYNGILSIGDIYKCLFCGTLLNLDQAAKERHIISESHKRMMDKHPHVEEFSHNLIRKLTDNSTYCTICNVEVDNIKLFKHICTDAHLQELDRAETRALTYKTYE